MRNRIEAKGILNIPQLELAERVDVSRQTINSIDAGSDVPSALLALKIVSTFSVREIFILKKSGWK
jgi:putative transcriptional regulator